MLKALPLALAAALFAGPANAAQPLVATVDLANFRFTPSQLQLRANTPTVLQLRNTSSGGHNFSAPAFFAAARLDAASTRLVRRGKVEIPGRSTVQLSLIPTAGQYPLKCTHTLHSAFGMNGTIIVR
jgi:plastocyanin